MRHHERLSLPFHRHRRMSQTLGLLMAAFIAVAVGSAAAGEAAAEDSSLLPIVFVHGQSGSAQQFETQAMRFTSNGYPQDLLFAFEYDTSLATNPLADLDAFLDDVLAETGADQVYAIGHSRGTSVWTTYLDDPGFDGPAKVAKYANIDGRSPEELPGGVPTIGIWGEWNTAGSGYNRRGDTNAQIGPNPEDNFYFGTKSHTETATSPEAFAVMYEFFTGQPPATTDVVPEPPGSVRVAGRAVIFPENIGYDGGTVEVWRVDSATGQRISENPRVVYVIDASGEFGPIKLNGRSTTSSPCGDRPLPWSPSRRCTISIPSPSAAATASCGSRPADPGRVSRRSSRGRKTRPTSSSRDSASSGAIRGPRAMSFSSTASTSCSPTPARDRAVNLAVFVYDQGPYRLPPDGVTDLSKGVLYPFNRR